jgi:hypothetical protein
MFYRQTASVSRKPLKPRELWWWEIKFFQAQHWIVAAYFLLIQFLTFCYEQFWKKESYPGQYEQTCSPRTNERRCQALMQESAKLMAVFGNPDAVRHRDQTIEMYTTQRTLIAKKLERWYSPLVEYWLPRSLYAHDCRWARRKMLFLEKLVNDMQNTPLKKLGKKKERIEQDLVIARDSQLNGMLALITQRDLSGLAVTDPEFVRLCSVIQLRKDQLDADIARLEQELEQCNQWLATENDCSLAWYERYSGLQEREFSSSIPDWFYDEQQRSNELAEIRFLMSDRKDLETHDGRKWKETARALVHPNHQLWLGRKLMYSYQGTFEEGHIHLTMWFDPIQFAFMYTTNIKSRVIDYRILQSAAVRYVLTFRCLDFFIDDDYFSFMKYSIHPEIRNYFIQKDHYLQAKKRVRMPDGTHQWMLEEDFKNQLLARQGFPDPTKYYIVNNHQSSEIEQVAQQHFEERQNQAADPTMSTALVEVTQEEIDEYYMKQITIYEKAVENPNSVATNGPRIRQLRAAIPDFATKLRLRFEQVVNPKDEPYELSFHKHTNDPYFTNAEFEMHVVLYHGPNSRYPINRTGKMILETDSTLNGFDNSQRMIEFCYDNADPSTILEKGLERIEQARGEARRLCELTNRDPNDFGMMLGKMRIDQNALVNSDAVEKLRITYEINELIRSGTDVDELVLQLEDLPATIPMQYLRDRQEENVSQTKRILDIGSAGSNMPSLQVVISEKKPASDLSIVQLLETGNRNSNYLEVHGYELMKTEEEKSALENKLVRMRQECIVQKLNEFRNTEYLSSQIHQNVAMMQSGRYIDKKKEARRFQRHKHSHTFADSSVKLLTYAQYVEEAKQNMQKRLQLQSGREEVYYLENTQDDVDEEDSVDEEEPSSEEEEDEFEGFSEEELEDEVL